MILNTSSRSITILLALLLSFPFSIHAQLFERGHADGEKTPKFVLVQLPAQSRKISWYSKNGKNNAMAEKIANDAEQIRAAMVKDFTDNFKFCPVYYYIDTNAGLVKQKKFDGILMDKNMKVVSNANNIRMKYQIVIYTTGATTSDEYNSSGGNPKDAGYTTGMDEKRLVVFDENFNKVQPPAPNGMHMTALKAMLFGGKYKQYKYRSKVQNFTYLPFAGQLSEKMMAFYK